MHRVHRALIVTIPFLAAGLVVASTLFAAVTLNKKPPARPRSDASSNGGLALANSHSGEAIMSAERMTPGEETHGTVTIRNSGKATGVLTLATSALADEPGPNGGVLSDILDLTITDVTGGSDGRVYAGSLAAMRRTSPITLVPGDSRTFRFSVRLPETADSRFLISSTTLGYRWTITSAKDRDCFNRLTGDAHKNRLIGSLAGDRLRGLSNADRLSSLAGNDCLWGGDGADRLSGGAGRDRLDGGRGHDQISGGDGADTILARDGTYDSIDCGAGRDTAVVDRIDRVKHCETVRRG
jgi:Ca2+-binding RTX toxin-like protein